MPFNKHISGSGTTRQRLRGTDGDGVQRRGTADRQTQDRTTVVLNDR